MGNKPSKRPRDGSQTNKRKNSKLSKQHVQPSSKATKQYTYTEVFNMIEEQLNNYVSVDICGLILSFIPRSTIGDESNPINPYDVVNVHVHLISPCKIPSRVLSIFNLLSPNCQCGAVLIHQQFQERKDAEYICCGRCKSLLGRNEAAPNCLEPHFECPTLNSPQHPNLYKICERCIHTNVDTQSLKNHSNLFSDTHTPYSSSSLHGGLLSAQRRVCLAFTEDYVRVHLHCFRYPKACSRVQYCNELRASRGYLDRHNNQIGILLDDMSEACWEERGAEWLDYMELWTDGGDASVKTALCHCNQTNNKIGQEHRQRMEKHLSMKQQERHYNIHDINKRERAPWKSLSPKLFSCSITENEDTLTAILDIVGSFLSNVSEKEKYLLTYRGKFNKK